MFLGVQPNRIRETRTLSGFVPPPSRLPEVVCHPVFSAHSILIHFSRRTFGLASSSFGSQFSSLYRPMIPRSLVPPSRSSSFSPRILLLRILILRLLGICAPKQSSLQKLLHYPIRLCRLQTEPLIAYPLPSCLFPRCVKPPD